MHKTVIVSVSTKAERDKVISNIFNQYDCMWSDYYDAEIKNRNTISIFYRESRFVPDHLRKRVITYIIVIISVSVNIGILQGFSKATEFRLESTIDRLKELLSKLESLQNGKRIREIPNGSTFRELAGCLSQII